MSTEKGNTETIAQTSITAGVCVNIQSHYESICGGGVVEINKSTY